MAVTINGSGQVPVQVVSTTKTDTFSTSSSSFVPITGLSVSITPTSSSSKVLILLNVVGTANISTSGIIYSLRRGSTVIFSSNTDDAFNGGSSGNTYLFVPAAAQFLDSPSTTSSVTYSVYCRNTSGNTSYINRSENNIRFGTSSITVMEISG